MKCPFFERQRYFMLSANIDFILAISAIDKNFSELRN